jgi:hypothetical protein
MASKVRKVWSEAVWNDTDDRWEDTEHGGELLLIREAHRRAAALAALLAEQGSSSWRVARARQALTDAASKLAEAHSELGGRAL